MSADWYDPAAAGRQLCPRCQGAEHCRGGEPLCECLCTQGPGGLHPVGATMYDTARWMLEQAQAITASVRAESDQVLAGLRVRQSQLTCVRCFGDPYDPVLPRGLGQGECTCELRCARLFCQATRDGELP
jgi:hypothetical protein